MGALTPDQRAVVPRHFTVWAAAIERHPADPTVFIIGHPQPGRHSAPMPDLHLHPLSWAASPSDIQHELRFDVSL